MKIAIDLNDVIRNFTGKFEELYSKNINNEFDISFTIEDSDGDFSKIFPFESKDDYNRFVYEDYPLELFGNAPIVNKTLIPNFNIWINNLMNNGCEKTPEVFFVCPNEHYLSIQSTCFFLSKFMRLRKVIFTTSSKETWDSCDILITANPILIKNKPNNKKLIKINTDYNQNYTNYDFNFDRLNEFIEYTTNVNVSDLRDKCIDDIRRNFSCVRDIQIMIGSYTIDEYKTVEEERKSNGEKLNFEKIKYKNNDTILEIRFYLNENDVLIKEDLSKISKFIKEWFKSEIDIRKRLRKIVFK